MLNLLVLPYCKWNGIRSTDKLLRFCVLGWEVGGIRQYTQYSIQHIQIAWPLHTDDVSIWNKRKQQIDAYYVCMSKDIKKISIITRFHPKYTVVDVAVKYCSGFDSANELEARK